LGEDCWSIQPVEGPADGHYISAPPVRRLEFLCAGFDETKALAVAGLYRAAGNLQQIGVDVEADDVIETVLQGLNDKAGSGTDV
jgi:hypothetical protein